MKKIIIKKSNKFRVLYLKVKTALFNNKKLIVLNNYNLLSLKSKELNSSLRTRLVNNNIVRGLKLKFPISGLSKIIKFKTLSEFSNLVLILATNKAYFDIVLVKIFDKVYSLQKFNNLVISQNFLVNKKKFLNSELFSRVNSLNFCSNYFLSILNFFNLLKKKNDHN